MIRITRAILALLFCFASIRAQAPEPAILAVSALSRVVPASTDILTCSATPGITTAPVAFATTWTMPPFSQSPAGAFGLSYHLALTSGSSAPALEYVLYADSTPIYASLSSAPTASLTNLTGQASFNIVASTPGTSGSVGADAPTILALTPTQALNRAVTPVFLDGTFATSPGPWSVGSGFTISGGALTGATASSATTQPIAIVAGVSYSITYTVSSYSAGTIATLLEGLTSSTHAANGTFTDTFTAGLLSTTTAGFQGAGFTGSITNVSVSAAALQPAFDTTISHTVSLAIMCNASTAGTSVQLLQISQTY